MRKAKSTKEYDFGILKDVKKEGIVNDSHQIVESIHGHGTAGYILKKVTHYDRDEKQYSLPFYYTIVDVVSMDDPMFFETYHSIGIQTSLVEVLKSYKVPYMNIYDFKYKIHYWVDMNYFVGHAIKINQSKEDIFGGKMTMNYSILPFDEYDIVYEDFSIYPSYLKGEKNIDVTMIPNA